MHSDCNAIVLAERQTDRQAGRRTDGRHVNAFKLAHFAELQAGSQKQSQLGRQQRTMISNPVVSGLRFVASGSVAFQYHRQDKRFCIIEKMKRFSLRCVYVFEVLGVG